ncbi:hypothetical protein HWV62_40146 [Athelia sp. TMB]|nr:hypothetical protein HWV62_40146 [Athelia sp. TMB]
MSSNSRGSNANGPWLRGRGGRNRGGSNNINASAASKRGGGPGAVKPQRQMKMELMASVSRSSGLEKDGDAALGKLREGVVASKRSDSFAVEGEPSLLARKIVKSMNRHLSIREISISGYNLRVSSRHNDASSSSAAYPSQSTFRQHLAGIPASLLPVSSDSRIWIESLTGSLRAMNYAKFEQLSRPSSFAPLCMVDSHSQNSHSELATEALHLLVEALRNKARENIWRIVRSAYREVNCDPASGSTREWLARSLALPSGSPTSANVLLDNWLERKLTEGQVRKKDGIGFGNWGSVWLCRPKCNPASPSADGFTKRQDMKVAVKLVHRSKTEASIARVRSLWNEMKIVRSFKNDPHPSIIPFHSFIITPSYALITMSYLPTLIPVEVSEKTAKWWFRSLLSAVDFLHQRGIVHNDIKPANILLSDERVPVFVDFGFAEKYNLASSKAFHSNLKYGTPEYLSPERARGLPHDTRKSDMWSLGVTFFEILIGRTPFEVVDGEEFCTEEDMEKYWARTLKGKWVGEWTMSKGMEQFLRRMIAPNADLRCTAADAMGDCYWSGRVESIAASHKRAASASPSVALDKEMSKLMDMSLPWSPHSASSSTPKSKQDKENMMPTVKETKEPKSIFSAVSHTRSKSQPKVASPKPVAQAKKRPAVHPMANLSPGMASPPASPFMASPAGNKENMKAKAHVGSLNSMGSPRQRQPFSSMAQNLPPAPKEKEARRNSKLITKNKENSALQTPTSASKRNSILKDMTGLHDCNVGQPTMVVKPKSFKAQDTSFSVSVNAPKKDDSVRKRVNEWEREKERIREMERLEAFEKERDEEAERARNLKAEESTLDTPFGSTSSLVLSPDKSIQVAQVAVRASAQIMPTPPSFLDKGVRICKSSVGNMTGWDTTGRIASMDEPAWRVQVSELQPEDTQITTADSLVVEPSQGTVPDCEEEEKLDRMNLWMRDVEKVVEHARQNFVSASTVSVAPLPVPPSRSSSQNRTTRSSRLPRKVLAASQIFSPDASCEASTSLSTFLAADPSSFDKTLPTIPSETTDFIAMSTPPRRRRATITTRSPELKKQESFDIDASPSKRRGKARSQGNLLRPIETIERLELELQKDALPPTNARLSAFLEPSLFVATPKTSKLDFSNTTTDTSFVRSTKSLDINHLTASPVHIEPYPPRKSIGAAEFIDSPNRRRIENVYDRFLMATAGVKRVGRGYQSDNLNSVQDQPPLATSNPKRSHYSQGTFNSSRRAMPPPISSEDLKVPGALDEYGHLTCRSITPEPPHHKDEGHNTVAFVRRAFKAVAGKTVSRRLSRAIA